MSAPQAHVQSFESTKPIQESQEAFESAIQPPLLQQRPFSTPLSEAAGSVSRRSEESQTTRLFESVLSIMSEESGLEISEIKDQSVLSEMGIDSLLILIIAGRLEEELDLDFDSAKLSSMASIGELRHSLEASEREQRDLQGPSRIVELAQPQPHEPLYRSEYERSRSGFDAPEATCSKAPDLLSADRNFKHALKIISEESEIQVSNFTNDMAFADTGVDSLLSLIIVDRLKDELSLDFEFENTFFIQFPTVRDIKAHFGIEQKRRSCFQKFRIDAS